MDSLNHISDEINMHICFLRQLIDLQCTRLVRNGRGCTEIFLPVPPRLMRAYASMQRAYASMRVCRF